MDNMYLNPGKLMDSDHPDVIAYTHLHTQGLENAIDQMVKLYLVIRDSFAYDAYELDVRGHTMKASFLLGKKRGYCIQKSNLLGACARVLGIPSRLGFANVRNHLGTEKLERLLGTNLMVFHGYTELFLNDKWVKATPAFNKSLCEKLKVEPLDFNGQDDSIFQAVDSDGKDRMKYEHNYGTFAEWPRELFLSEIMVYYGHLFDEAGNPGNRILDFLKNRSA